MSRKLGPIEPMPDALTDEHLRKWIAAAEKREMARSSTKKPQAREALARDLRVGYWTITNLLRRRLKGLRGDLRDKIKMGIINHLESEIHALEHELALVKQCGSGISATQIHQAEAALEQARAFLK